MQERVKGKFASKRPTKTGNLTPFASKCLIESIEENRTDVEDTLGWKDGRRVVELGLLAKHLEACVHCRDPLFLSDVVRETRYGLGSLLYVKCRSCFSETTVPTGKRHNSSSEEGPARCFDVNTKLAAAMLNAGVGELQINNILSALNIPPILHKSLKEREREIGRTVESVAEISCNQAVLEEVEAIESLNTDRSEAKVQPEVSTDGAWQRRGNGRSHNSMSGHVTLIGKIKKKCLNFGVAKKSCRICKSNEKKWKTPVTHDCRKNWNGSAKAMEPFLTVNGLNKLKEKGLCVKKLIMDDDTTTFVRAKRSLSDDIEKAGDKNHIIKNMNNELYKIKEKNKNMSVKTIKYFSKCIAYALSQNQGNPEGIRSNLKAVTPHAFGCHDHCNASWCRYLVEKDNYSHKTLPFGKDLVGEELRADLEALFSRYTSDAMLKKLSDLQSSNPNENLNQMIARKAPKAVHYSGSESLDYRISAAVSQKNEGHSYLVKVNETHKLSPGKFTQKKVNELDKKRDSRKLTDNTIEKKRRRLALKEARLSNQNTQEVLEGKTYESGVSVLDDTESIEIEEIPAMDTLIPTCANSEVIELDNFIIFDLETTGLNFDANIIQIAATDMITECQFETYVQPPTGYIPRRVTEVTGLEMHGSQMYHQLAPVKSVTIQLALDMFKKWMKQFSRCVLVAHNANFDSKVFMNACDLHSIHVENLVGFADSLKLFRSIYPDRKGRGAHSQSSLVHDILHKNYEAHNAIADVRSLKELLISVESVEEKLSVFSVKDVKNSIKRIRNEKKFYQTYTQMIEEKLIPKSHAKSLSGSGLSLKHLNTIHERSGVQGLKAICTGVTTNPAKAASNISAAFLSKKQD